MNRFLTLLFSLLFTGLAFSQDIKVSVLSNNEPLSYSYYYINGKILGATDSMGVCRISKSILNIGDTISASYVGISGSIVYDQALSQNVQCVINIAESRLDEVVVTASGRSDAFKLFKKYVNVPELILYKNLIFNVDFSFSGEIESLNRACKGSFSVCYEDLSPRHPYKITDIGISGDTIGVMTYIVHELRNGIMFPATAMIKNRERSLKTKLRYLGVRDNNHLFAFTFNDHSVTFQSQIYADVSTGFVNRIDSYSYNTGAYYKMQSYYLQNKKGEINPSSLNVHYSDPIRNVEYYLDIPKIILSQLPKAKN